MSCRYNGNSCVEIQGRITEMGREVSRLSAAQASGDPWASAALGQQQQPIPRQQHASDGGAADQEGGGAAARLAARHLRIGRRLVAAEGCVRALIHGAASAEYASELLERRAEHGTCECECV